MPSREFGFGCAKAAGARRPIRHQSGVGNGLLEQCLLIGLVGIGSRRPPVNHVLDGLLALYADDAVHVSPKLRDRQPETKGEIRGKAALRAWWQDAFIRLPQLTYAERRVVAEGDSVFLEYVRTVPGEPDLVVAELYVVDAAGLISRSHVFHG